MSRPVTVLQPPALQHIHPLAALGRLPRFSDLFLTLSAHRVRVRYKQSRLGIVWAVIQPLAMMLVFTLMFNFLGGAPSAGAPYPLFAFAALLPWLMFASGLTSASGALTSHAALLTKVYFPREILPLTYVVAALVDFAIASIVLAGLMVWYGVALTPLAGWSLVALGMLTALLVGAGLLVSALQVRYRDVGLAMPVLLQVWMFASPILYPLADVKDRLPPSLYALYVLNPIAGIIDTFRGGIVLQQPPDMQALGSALVVVVLLLPTAYVYFKFTELTMADVV